MSLRTWTQERHSLSYTLSLSLSRANAMALADCLPVEPKKEEEGAPSQPEFRMLRSVFDACDENGDGFLTLEELCAWMKKLDLHLTREGLQEIVQSCDRNLDGRLDFDEFVTLSASLDIPSSSTADRAVANPGSEGSDGSVTEDSEITELQEAFRVFDKDSNGFSSDPRSRS